MNILQFKQTLKYRSVLQAQSFHPTQQFTIFALSSAWSASPSPCGQSTRFTKINSPSSSSTIIHECWLYVSDYIHSAGSIVSKASDVTIKYSITNPSTTANTSTNLGSGPGREYGSKKQPNTKYSN